ncbi:MAG: arsenate reductase family protein [Bacteroidota bacterium]
MNTVFYLSTCDTCKRILKEIQLPEKMQLQDLKKEAISEQQLAELHQHTNSYEALFNKRAQLYKKRNLKEKNLSESDFKALLLEHYTFLKRPVFTFDDAIFVGNAKKTVQSLKDYLAAD